MSRPSTSALLAAGLLAASAAEAGPKFVNVTAASGIDYVQQVFRSYSSVNELPPQQYFFSGGAAAGDYDGDGWPDLYVARFGASDILYRNMGNGKFEDVTDAAFGPRHLAAAKTNGVAWGDIDNDGDLDLYVTTIEHSRHYLYVNNGNGTFTEGAVTRGAHVPEVGPGGARSRYGFSAAFGDYDRDGFVDLHVTEWRQEGEAIPGQYWIDHPDVRHNTRLLRNRGASQPGYFDDVTDAAGVATEKVPSSIPEIMNSEGFAPRFSDIDRDGWPDLLLASDHTTSRLFWNNGDGTFADGTAAAGVGRDRFGMGNTVGDIDNDGDLDWFVTSVYREGDYGSAHVMRYDGNRLYRNDGNRTFSDVTIPAGVLDGGWGWGAAFIDYDNDGDEDLFMTNGFDVILDSQTNDDLFENDQSILWRNDGNGKFVKISDEAGIVDRLSGKGVVTFDYDQDGDVDLFIVNTGEQPILYRNDGGNANNWLRLKLEGRGNSNRQALNAFVTITPDRSKPERIMVRELTVGSHYLGQSEAALHFGVGKAKSIDEVRIEWPDGAVSRFKDLGANKTYEIAQTLAFTSNFHPKSAFVGRAFTYRAQANIQPVALEAKGLPAWLSFDPATGIFSGTPPEEGSFKVSLLATATGESTEQTLVIHAKRRGGLKSSF